MSPRREPHARYVTLRGGPCDGLSLTVTWGQSLLMESAESSGEVARYRPGRENGIYTFRGMDRVVATLPAPGDGTAAS